MISIPPFGTTQSPLLLLNLRLLSSEAYRSNRVVISICPFGTTQPPLFLLYLRLLSSEAYRSNRVVISICPFGTTQSPLLLLNLRLLSSEAYRSNRYTSFFLNTFFANAGKSSVLPDISASFLFRLQP